MQNSSQNSPVLYDDFCLWAKSYVGPKFNFLHCDFPPKTPDQEYWNLFSHFGGYLDNFLSHSAHVMFWFSPQDYDETLHMLRAMGLSVLPTPVIWHKTGGPREAPREEKIPYSSYETAFIASRGNREFLRFAPNIYGCPTVSNRRHPFQKPESMLRHFMKFMVDEFTSVLDPACGSGSALKVAEELGAKSILGIEKNFAYAEIARARVLQGRTLQQVGG